MTVPLESEEQEVLAMQLDAWGLLWTHVPGGDAFLGKGPQRFSRARRLEKSGVKPGVPDVLIFDPPPNQPAKRGCAIELKRARGPRGGKPANGSMTGEQRMWLCLLSERSWLVPLSPTDVRPLYGAAEAIEWLRTVAGYGR